MALFDRSPENFPARRFDLNRDVPPPGEERTRLLLARLSEQAAGLRAAAKLLGERIENLHQLAPTRRAG